MNPSRDIEKLFDQFGGDAGNYQEIGRENEASHARTRWPLLATLDLSQPSIPNIAPRRESLLSQTHDRSGENRNPQNSLTQPPGAAPVNRARPPLFARAHRKTIPPVANVTLPVAPIGAERFSALVDAVEVASNAASNAAEAPAVPQVTARLQQQQPMAQQPQQSLPRSQPLATPAPTPAPMPGLAAALQLKRPQPAVKPPSLPRIPSAPAVPEAKAHSILGKLFRAQTHVQAVPQASETRPDSLQSMFERLREPVAATPAPAAAPGHTPAPAAGSWLAKRASQS
jgi:hypothetical protein